MLNSRARSLIIFVYKNIRRQTPRSYRPSSYGGRIMSVKRKHESFDDHFEYFDQKTMFYYNLSDLTRLVTCELEQRMVAPKWFKQYMKYLRFVYDQRRGLPVRRLIVHGPGYAYTLLESGLMDACLESIAVVMSNRKVNTIVDYINRNHHRLREVLIVQPNHPTCKNGEYLIKLMAKCVCTFDYFFAGNTMVMYNGPASRLKTLKQCGSGNSIVDAYRTGFVNDKPEIDIIDNGDGEGGSNIDHNELRKNILSLPVELQELIVSHLPTHVRYKIAQFLKISEKVGRGYPSSWYNVLGFFNETPTDKSTEKCCDNSVACAHVLYKYLLVHVPQWQRVSMVINSKPIKTRYVSMYYNDFARNMILAGVFDKIEKLVLYVDYYVYDMSILYEFLNKNNFLNRVLIVYKLSNTYRDTSIYEIMKHCSRKMIFKYKFNTKNKNILMWDDDCEAEIPPNLDCKISKTFNMQIDHSNKIIIN